MVCLEVVFGCKNSSSADSYIFSALIIMAILLGLRILCYAMYLMLKRNTTESPGHEASSDGGDVDLRPSL
nr:Urease accessory protein like [Ipomoea batatas]